MAFESNPFLRDLVGTSELFRKAASDTGQMREQAARFALSEQAPTLLADAGMSQPLSDFAGLSIASGDPVALRDILSKLYGPKTTEASPVGMERAKILGKGVSMTDPSLLDALSIIPEKDAIGFLGLAQRKAQGDRTGDQKDESIGIARAAQDRLLEKEWQAQAGNFKQDISKFEKEVADQAKALSSVKSALTTGTKPSQSIVENFVLRNLAGEKGPLSDSDRASVAAKAGFNTFVDFQNYITANPSNTWSEAQTDAFKDLVNMADAKFAAYKDQRATDILSQSNLLAKFSGSERGQKLKDEFAKRHGFEGGNGTYKKKGDTERIALTMETPVDKIIESIKDPKVKKQAEDAKAHYKGQIPEAIRRKLIEAAKGQ